MSSEIDKIDLEILNSLADDYESLEQIVPMVQRFEPDADEKLIAAKVEKLLASGLVCRESDIYGCSDYDDWFGMTTRGCEVWEESCAIFSYDPPDWSASYRLHKSYVTCTGDVCGVSQEICEAIIARDMAESVDIVIDSASFKYSSIEEFQATYYKTLKGGHRIDFIFTKINRQLK